MEKTASDDGPPPNFDDRERNAVGEKVPAHFEFRKRVSPSHERRNELIERSSSITSDSPRARILQ